MRVVIAGPIAGGSLPVAKAAAAAFTGLGYDAIFMDYSGYADEFLKAVSGSHEERVAFTKSLEAVLLKQIDKSKPDVLLGIAQSPLFDVGLLDGLRESGVITAFWFVEDFRVLKYWKWLAPHFDIFFSIQTETFARELAAIGSHNHCYLPVAFDTSATELLQPQAPMPLSFMGAPYPNRVRILEKLSSYDLSIYGNGWHRYPIRGVRVGNRWITEAEVRWIYRHTEINLNIHSSMEPGCIGGDFVNPRTFELAGMGCFQLSDRRELLPPLYSDDEIVQFGDEAELMELIDYYLDHPAERNQIARNAQRRTLKNHLYEHRVVEIMEAVEKLSERSGEGPPSQ